MFQKFYLRIKLKPGTDGEKRPKYTEISALLEVGPAPTADPEQPPLCRFKTPSFLTHANHSKDALCVTSPNLEGASVLGHLLGTLPRSGGKQERLV